MKNYGKLSFILLVLAAFFAVQSASYADHDETRENAVIFDMEDETPDADLSGSHGEDTTPYMAFVTNSYQYGKLLTVEEKEAELSAITDPSTVEIIDFIHQGILNMEEEILLEDFQIDPDTLNICYQTLMNNYPDMYYIDLRYRYFVFEDGTVDAIIPIYTMSQQDVKDAQALIDEEVEKVLACVDSSMNRFDKVAAVNNYFAENYVYDYDNLNDSEYIRKYTIPAIFIDKTAVCQGYSLAFQYIMNKLDIPCTTAQSPPMAHMWNLVQAKEGSDNWYNIDVTWDSIYYGEYNMSAYTFFLKSDNRFQNMHNVSGYTTAQDHHDYTPDGWAKDETIDELVISSTPTDPIYMGGYWYFGKGKYDFANPVTIYRYNSATNATESVLSIDDTWIVAAGVYAGYYFNSAAAYDGKLYYNDSLNVYVYDPATGESKIFLKEPKGVEKEKTPIFEVRVEGDNLIYVTAPDYPGNGVVTTEHSVRISSERVEYIGDVQVYGTSIGISITDADGANKVVASFFDKDGRFISCDIVDYSTATLSEYRGDIPDGAKTLSVFAVYVDEKGQYEPVGDAVKKDI